MRTLLIYFSKLACLAVIILLSTSICYATNGTKFLDFQYALGLQSDGRFDGTNLSDISKDTVIYASVIDPTKLGGCKNGDTVKMKNLGDGRWELQHAITSSTITVIADQESGNLNVKKIGSFSSINGTSSSNSPYQMNLAGRSAFGVRVSYVNYSDDSYVLYPLIIDTTLDDAPMFGVNFSFFPSDYFSIEFSADYVQSDLSLSSLGLSFESGKLKQIPLLLVGRLHAPIKNIALPYLGGGVGYFINDFDQEDNIIQAIYGSGAKVSVDNSVGFLINGGVDFFITQNFAFNVDIKYIWNKIDAKVNKLGYSEEDFDADMFVIGGGLKLYF